MTDPLEKLEAELNSMRPLPPTSDLRAGIEARLTDGLEEELGSLRPEPASQRLRAGLERRLGGPPVECGEPSTAAGSSRLGGDGPTVVQVRLGWAVAALAAAAAIGVVVGLLVFRALDGGGRPREPQVVEKPEGESDRPKASDGTDKTPGGAEPRPGLDPNAPPTLAAYRLAAASEADLDALLSRHAGRLLPAGAGATPRAGRPPL
jgi:hypothetical protein